MGRVLNLAHNLSIFFSQQESIQLQLSSFPSLQEEDKSSKDDSEKEKEKDKNKDKNSEKSKIRMLSKGELKNIYYNYHCRKGCTFLQGCISLFEYMYTVEGFSYTEKIQNLKCVCIRMFFVQTSGFKVKEPSKLRSSVRFYLFSLM